MTLKSLLSHLDQVDYSPRTLELNLPPNLTESLSGSARAFLEVAFGKTGLTVPELTSDKWKDDPVALDFFVSCEKDVQVEILAFLTLFVHEFTHRIDFLISPFGLQYYVNTLREYWRLQEFFPQMLDNPGTVDHMRFLVGFAETAPKEEIAKTGFQELWEELEGIIHTFYAWGDVSGIKPIGKYIKDGWSDQLKGPGDPFGIGIVMEPVTILKFFHTFRVPGADKFWYLRPLTIFETKAIVNSLLFILHVLGERGAQMCLGYYESVYLRRQTDLPQDYFFLLDLGSRIYEMNDFYTLLKQANHGMLRSTLLILSTVCWYALQAPPFLKGEDLRIANPILRLWLSFMFMCALVRGRLKAPFNSTAEALLLLDGSKKLTEEFYAKPIKDIIPACRKVIDNMIEMNQLHTWHPDVKKHFEHIFTLMRPHFVERDLSYVSYLGMPEHGNPLYECRTKEDWELTYEDYQTPEGVKEWFSIRTDLFFNLLKPADEVIKRLDNHFLAFLIPYNCECGQGITMQWASCFANEFKVSCGFCGQEKMLPREDFSIHVIRKEDQ